MQKFRKKPIVIEAEQFWPEQPTWPPGVVMRGAAYFIKTLEGEHVATPGDWIIRGIANELYPCKPEIFELTYEPYQNGRNSDSVHLVMEREGGGVGMLVDTGEWARVQDILNEQRGRLEDYERVRIRLAELESTSRLAQLEKLYVAQQQELVRLRGQAKSGAVTHAK